MYLTATRAMWRFHTVAAAQSRGRHGELLTHSSAHVGSGSRAPICLQMTEADVGTVSPHSSLRGIPGTTTADIVLRNCSQRASRNKAAGIFVMVHQEAGLRRQWLLTSCRHGRLHYAFHNVFTNLEPHIRADTGREAVMKAGPDTTVGNLIGKDRHVGKAVGCAGCSSARYRDLECPPFRAPP